MYTNEIARSREVARVKESWAFGAKRNCALAPLLACGVCWHTSPQYHSGQTHACAAVREARPRLL
jgi:hypothetical protein